MPRKASPPRVAKAAAAPKRRPASARPPAEPSPPSAQLAALDHVPAAVRSLHEISETLHYAHQSFHEALLRLPHAEDFEPLTEPLREFARASPALAEALRDVLAAMRDAVASVAATGRQMAAALAAEHRGPGAAPEVGSAAEAADLVDAARDAILEALAGMPRDADYAPVAAQLRELATVSPSLMEWLREVPKVATPLADAVRGLHQAAADLKAARGLLRNTSD